MGWNVWVEQEMNVSFVQGGPDQIFAFFYCFVHNFWKFALFPSRRRRTNK